MAEDEQTEQGGGFQGAVPLLASVAAGAAAGAIAVVARKALSGGGGDEGEGGDEPSRDGGRDDDRGTAFDDIGQVADDLEGLVDELRGQAEGEPDFRRLIELADAISEYADQAANAFEASSGSDDEEDGSERRVTDDLMNRIGQLTGGEREEAGAREGARKSREKEPA
jgi:hypothetical protein